MPSLFRRLRDSLDRRRTAETSIRPRIYVGAAGRKRHLVQTGPGGPILEVSGPQLTFRPGAVVITGSFTNIDPAETILSEPPHPGGSETPPIRRRQEVGFGPCDLITGKTYIALVVEGTKPFASSDQIWAQLYEDGNYVSDLGNLADFEFSPGYGTSTPWAWIIRLSSTQLSWLKNFSADRRIWTFPGSVLDEAINNNGLNEWPGGPVANPQSCSWVSGGGGNDAAFVGGQSMTGGSEFELGAPFPDHPGHHLNTVNIGMGFSSRFLCRGVNISTTDIVAGFITKSASAVTLIDPAGLLNGRVGDLVRKSVPVAGALSASLLKHPVDLVWTVGLCDDQGNEIQHWPSLWGLDMIESSIWASPDGKQIVGYPAGTAKLLRTRVAAGVIPDSFCPTAPTITVEAGPEGTPHAMIPLD